MTSGKHWIIFVYLLYGFLLTGVLLVVRFPGKPLRQYCARAVERMLPGTMCTIGGIDYDFPSTLHIHDIHVTLQHSPEDALLLVKNLSVNLEPRQADCRLQAEAYDGRHECRLVFKGKTFTLADVKIRHLNLGQWGALQHLLGRKISGFLDVTGTYTGRPGGLMAGEAKGAVVVREGSMELLQPILSLNTINFQDVETEFALRDQIVTMQKGNYHGAEFNGTFSGTIQVAEPLGSGTLGVNGNLTPLSLADVDPRWNKRAGMLPARYKQTTLPFAISGTLAGPLFRFDG